MPKLPPRKTRGKGLAFALWFVSLFTLLMGLDYISSSGGRSALLIAVVSGVAGYYAWPKTKR